MSGRRRTSAFWDEELVRAAVDGATSVVQSLERLGYANKPSNRRRLKEACNRWNLRWPAQQNRVPRSASRKATGANGAPVRSWTDDDLVRAAAGAPSMAVVVRNLGLQPTSSTYDRIERRAAEIGTRLPSRRGGGRCESPIDSREFTAANRTHLLEILGWSRGASNYARLERTAERLGIDLPPKGARRPGVVCGRRPRPLEELLVKGSTVRSTYLRKRLIDEGVLEERCKRCRIGPVWCGEPLTLQLDHINGDPTDNRLSNLRLLCPNCHAQTETYCGKNSRGRRAPRARLERAIRG